MELSKGSLQVREGGLLSSRLKEQKLSVASGQSRLLFWNFSAKTDTNTSCGSQHRKRLRETQYWVGPVKDVRKCVHEKESALDFNQGQKKPDIQPHGKHFLALHLFVTVVKTVSRTWSWM